MNSPIISVLMTTYNREKYVGAAIESVLKSSFKDFELVVVDDRSKDKTVDIVREWQAKDDRVKLFINEQNLGDYPNRNQAAAHATGKYLKYVALSFCLGYSRSLSLSLPRPGTIS